MAQIENETLFESHPHVYEERIRYAKIQYSCMYTLRFFVGEIYYPTSD